MAYNSTKPVINPLVKMGASTSVNGMRVPVTQGTLSTPEKAGSPERRLAADTAAGYKNADERGIGAEGSMGRLTDERKAEIDALLARQQAGLDGMTPAEMQAAREQGRSDINQQLSTNLSALGDIAAGNGVRGGSAAGLQMQAVGDANAASGELARKLILDNVAQKNIAMDRYGNTLQTQQGVGLGIQDANNQSSNAEKLARELAAGNYTSQLDSYRSGDKADKYTERGLDITEDQLKFMQDQQKNSTPEAKAAALKSSASASRTAEAQTGAANGVTSNENINKAMGFAPEIFTKPDGSLMSTEEVQRDLAQGRNSQLYRYIYAASVGKTPATLTKADEYAMNKSMGMSDEEAQANTTAQKIICTEAYRQGLISREKWEVTQRYRALLSLREFKGYLTWATPVVARMKKSAKFSRMLAPFIRRMIEGERYELGEVDSLTFGEHAVRLAVKAANYTAAFLRSLSLAAAPQAVRV